MLKFYYNKRSPMARRVWRGLLEKQIEFEPIVVNLNGDQMEPEYLELNPFHHVPVIVDDGFRVIESLAILDYLEVKYPAPYLLPKEPYVDASYTCMCPAIEMVEAGYQKVIAISNEPGVLYRDMFQLEEISESYSGADIYIIKPDVDMKELGVDFTDATEKGLIAAYQHGLEKGSIQQD